MAMGKGYIILTLSILGSLTTVTAQADPHTCNADNVYQPVPDPSEVASYLICLSATATPTIVKCPTDLVFNEALKGCGLAAGPDTSSKCYVKNQRIPAPPPTGTTTCSNFILCTYDEINGKFVETPDSCKDTDINFNFFLNKCVSAADWTCGDTRPDCDKPAYEKGYYPVLNDPDSHYQCIDTVLVKGKCAAGLYFDSVNQLCVKKTSSGGGGDDVGIVSIDKICEGKDGKFAADPNYCGGYYYCINGKTPYWGHCGEEQYFNNGFCTKTRPDTCKCEGVDTSKGKVYVPTTDETKYIICEKAKLPVQKTCPTGTIFDKEEKVCTVKTS